MGTEIAANGPEGWTAGGVRLLRLDRVDSTNLEAERRIRGGWREGARDAGPFMIVAAVQTAGEGRRGGRTWMSPPGGLWATLAWPLGDDARSVLDGLGLKLGVGCVRTVRRAGATANAAMLKWPNDVVVDAKKVCGCMGKVVGGVRGADGGDGARWVLAAAGINANNEIEPSLRERATSLRELTGSAVDLDALAERLAGEIAAALKTRTLDRATIDEANAMLAGVGAEVRLRDAGRDHRGTLVGIGSGGGPVVRADESEIELGPGAEPAHE